MAAALMSLDDLWGQWGDAPPAAFKACATYYEAMDVVLYLKEDVPYRADRVNAFLTLLWHPQEEKAIGVKLKGWRYLFERIKCLSAASGAEVPDHQFLPLTFALEVAVTAGLGNGVTLEAERDRLAEKADRAREVVRGVTLDAREIRAAA